MTKEELVNEAEEYIKANNLEWELECHRTSPIGEVEQAYIAGAEPREKQIERLSKEVDDLENMKATLEGRIAEQEAQIEKMKCCENCKHYTTFNNACMEYGYFLDKCDKTKWEIKEK